MTDRKIIKLTAENFMRLKAVSISPAGDVVYITGSNGEGKSSILNAICAALNWRDISGQIPEPIRQGENKASVSLDLGDMVVTRTWTPSGSQLKVESKDGAVYKSPQAMLDKFFSQVGFDPLEFVRMQPRYQRQTLMDLLGIDFSEFEQQRAALLKEKNVADNQVASLYQQIGELPEIPEDVPDLEVSAIDILREIDRATTHNDVIRQACVEYDRATRECLIIEDQIKELKEKLQKKMVERDNMPWLSLQDEIPIDIAPLKDQLTNIEQTNKQVRLKQQKATLLERLKQAEQAHKQINEDIACIDQDKRDCLESAKFPVKGLGFDESGVLFHGIPLKQASSAEQIRVSLAIGIAMNPAMKVLLIRDGSLMDSKSRELVAGMASKHGMQVWIEAVDESGKVGFVVEDGGLKSVSSGQQVIA